MSDASTLTTEALSMPTKVAWVLSERVRRAEENFQKRIAKAQEQRTAAFTRIPMTPWDAWVACWQYGIDSWERAILFWDTIRQRGNNYVEHERAGKPPVLHFEYETILDARKFERPVNYALLRILPPPGITIDPKRRPYIIIDPRAGHGPGIGGFKDDSQVGVALREGYPVYFAMFFPNPEPGQTLLDVCAAEQEFVREVRSLHPSSPRPAVVGNCQGGWAAMMLAASDPDNTGPLVINGAPMSYWGGAWDDEQVSNPMRYIGGLLGGSWPASLAADIGGGLFDGANLVQNFEALNPANTFWDKYYHLFANVDTEPPRFLEFERWWGGFYLLNREEMDWIVRNMFVGNKIWSGEVQGPGGSPLDLREIRSPIVLFASMGDNITPPQQAFNWIADVYGSTEEIKARGQTIVGLVHGSIGHLGIFVSGKVATKEHAAVVSVLKYIEDLPPGLYAMRVTPAKDEEGKPSYEVEFTERRLEDVMARVNRFGRRDEKPFEAAAAVSDFNQHMYDAFLRPFIQRVWGDFDAPLLRAFHPMRVQRWLFSDFNPWLAWLGPAAKIVASNRHAADHDHPLRQIERSVSDTISATLDYFCELRDAASEAAFYLTYGNIFTLQLAGKEEDEADSVRHSVVQEALDAITNGGYAAAVCRAGYLLARKGEPLPLARLELKHEFMERYVDLLPHCEPDERRRISGRQEIICQYAPDKAIETLPVLLSDPADRDRFFVLLDGLLADRRLSESVTPKQATMLKRIRQACKRQDTAAVKQAAL